MKTQCSCDIVDVMHLSVSEIRVVYIVTCVSRSRCAEVGKVFGK